MAVPLVFWTIVILGPIPVWHLLLHAFLPLWKKSPGAFYGASAGAWALFIPLSRRLSGASSALFVPPEGLKLACAAVGVGTFLIAVWSMITLTPRRFFLWEVLRPQESVPELIRRGPYRLTPHPTYLSMVVAVVSAFLASGELVLAGTLGVIAALLAVVVVLEQRELKARLNAPPAEMIDPDYQWKMTISAHRSLTKR